MAKIEIYTRLRPTRNRFAGIKTSPSHVSVQVNGLLDVPITNHVSLPSSHRLAHLVRRAEPKDSPKLRVQDTTSNSHVLSTRVPPSPKYSILWPEKSWIDSLRDTTELCLLTVRPVVEKRIQWKVVLGSTRKEVLYRGTCIAH